MALPLSGIKVVDMAQVLLGPTTAAYLADQGAEVIKVEPLGGDAMRFRHSSAHLDKHGFSKPFLALNRNKRGLALDVHGAEGQEIAHHLARWADVFILNFRVGTEVPVRLDYETLAAINPRLVYASVSALGRSGPDARLPGYDIAIQARSGILATRRSDDGTPVPSIIMMADMPGAMLLAYGIMLALWEREKTGRGQRVDISLLHAALAMQWNRLVWVDGDSSPLPGERPNALAAAYRCSDGRWIAVVASELRQFKALCSVLALEHLADDPGLATHELRTRKSAELREILGTALATRALDDWLERLRAAGVPCSPVLDAEELAADPQVLANEMLCRQDHPIVGGTQSVAPPLRLSNSSEESRLRRPAPALGQHSSEVLGELGYDEGQIERLRQAGVVR